MKWAMLLGIQLLMAMLLAGTCGLQAAAAPKQTIYNSPYVSFSPDGMAWTANAGVTDCSWYEEGTTVHTGISSSLRQLQTGEHYYEQLRSGEIPIGYWKVGHMPAQCIHNSYPADGQFHQIVYGKSNCGGSYYSGWIPYCADCGGELLHKYFYLSREAAETIDYLELGGNRGYYHLCPFCRNLEQGTPLPEHRCRGVSWNRYRVQYDVNILGNYGGYMEDSIHFYNDAGEYEGKAVTPVTRLTENAYTRIGYEFTGWNTKADGSGTTYADGARIRNLTTENWDEGGDKGIVKLYAQWRPCSSTLIIDAGGGTYQGKESLSLTDQYGMSYTPDNSQVIAPDGYRVSFQTNGGEKIASITGTQHFVEWAMQQPFLGRMKEYTYFFVAPDGSTDRIKALYACDPIVLPEAVKDNASFGGWYYDADGRQPAGGAGDTITPERDITLYAQWVELALRAKDNYTANDGKGAVDLSWTQPDGRNKSYLLYQSRDGNTWNQIIRANDIGSDKNVSQSFTYTGKSQTWTVPDTGIYTLTAYGAQGGNYGSYKGGAGGSVSGTFWLKEGEILTYTVGSQKGYGQGGTGSVYGSGGGSTRVSSNLKGNLLVAGGGGGAGANGNGGAGGSETSLITGSAGQDGHAGGGGGYQGGSAGELILHSHTTDCYRQKNGTQIPSSAFYALGAGTASFWGHYGNSTSSTATSAGTWAHSAGGQDAGVQLTVGNGATYLPTPSSGNGTLSYTLTASPWGDGYTKGLTTTVYFVGDDGKVTAQQINPLSAASVSSTYREEVSSGGSRNSRMVTVYRISSALCSGSISEHPNVRWQEMVNGSPKYYGVHWIWNFQCTVQVPIPAGTKGVYLSARYTGTGDIWYGVNIYNVSYSYSVTELVCGYQEGQVISSKPAYGGSSYVNKDYAYQHSSSAGVRTGDGGLVVTSQVLGYVEDMSMSGVNATDHTPPNRITATTVTTEALDGTRVLVSWQPPDDNGTDYYHKAESYLIGSTSLLSTSNVTKNTLTSGIKGYYYLTDQEAATIVTTSNADFIIDRSVEVTIGEQHQYLHVAAMDVAGNVGDTIHIPMEATAMRWKLMTEQLAILEDSNVYPAGRDRTWYVKADGQTAFTLVHGAYLDGTASLEYQPNYTIFETRIQSGVARNILYTPSAEVTDGEKRTEAEGLSYRTEGESRLQRYPFAYTVRSDRNRRLVGTQSFVMDSREAGKELLVFPVAGADQDGEIVYSSHEEDQRHGIILIGDAEAPQIQGLEMLEDQGWSSRREDPVILQALATDDLSGVAEFRIHIYNNDNTMEQTYTAEANDQIRIRITEDDPLFDGSCTVTAYVVDHVGNERTLEYRTTEFDLATKVKRILEPHDPIFKRGESGILTVTTWGYAERVEIIFPEELTALQPGLNTTYTYTLQPEYRQQEQLQFMIPLYAPTNRQYTITVRAYKGDQQLEEHPTFSIVETSGSILDELRTRLR